MRDPVLLCCPRCGEPAVVVDWGAVASLVEADPAVAAGGGLVAKFGAAMVPKLLRVPGRVVGPSIRRLLTEGAPARAWCCAACVRRGVLSSGVDGGESQGQDSQK